MQIRELPRGGQYSLKGNVINVPVDIQPTIALFSFSHFCDFRFYTSNKQNAISKKNKRSILLKIGIHFRKLLFKIKKKAKFQRISNSHF